jgi:uncharacterized protein (TIGR03437 family)
VRKCILISFIAVVQTATGQTTPSPVFAPVPGSPFAAGANPRVVVAGDFNGDQITDLAVVTPYLKQVTVLPGTLTGAPVEPFLNGTFTGLPSSFTLPTGTLPIAAVSGYFAGSGSLGLAIANFGDKSIWVYPAVAEGASANQIPLDGQPIALAVSDFDLDGNLDLAVATIPVASPAAKGSVTILFGDGTGNFPSSRNLQIQVGVRPASVAVGNFGGSPGLAVANQTDGTVTILSVGGSTSAGYSISVRGTYPVVPPPFNPPYAYPSAIGVADFNGDGFPDIVTANDGAANLSVLLGDARGMFTPAPGSPIAVGINPMALAVADFDGDGNQDLAVANYSSGTVTVLLGTGTGAFKAAAGSPYLSGQSPVSLAIGDFNGSGRPGLAIANQGDNTVTILLNGVTPATTVVSQLSFTAPVSPGSVIAIMGSGLASTSLPAADPAAPPFTLGDVSVVITYNNNTQDVLPILSVSPTQINAVIPRNSTPGGVNPVPGLATLTVLTPTKTLNISAEIVNLAPALQSAAQNGKGVALATFSNPLLPPVNVYQCNSATPPACDPVPLDLSLGGTLTLNASGLNNATSVTVTVGSQSATVTPVYQPTSPGMYQLTVPLPANPLIRGLVPVTVSLPPAPGAAAGIMSNTVNVLIE